MLNELSMHYVYIDFRKHPILVYSGFLIFFIIGYYLCGLCGLQLQSPLTGITPFWPASGWAFVFLLIYGLRYWPGIVIAMLLLSNYTGVSAWIGLTTGIAAVIEAITPLIIARHYGFSGRMDSLFESSVFTLIVIMSPMISAITGTVILYISENSVILPSLSTVMLWWLGNSIGLLIFGGILMATYEGMIKKIIFKHFSWKLLIIAAALSISWFAFVRNNGIDSVIILNLIIPLVLIGAVRFGAFGALTPSLVALIILLLIPNDPTTELFHPIPFNYLYLILVNLWFVGISGLLVAGAYYDRTMQVKMKWLAQHDTLTKLANRSVLKNETDYALRDMRRMNQRLCLLFIDLDHLKPVNDQLGHQAGDKLLISISQILEKHTRSDDIVARWGGDEFVVMLRNCELDKANIIANKILKDARDLSFTSNSKLYRVSMSIGVASTIADIKLDDLIKVADNACYKAKQSGRDQIVVSIIKGVGDNCV